MGTLGGGEVERGLAGQSCSAYCLQWVINNSIMRVR